MNNRVQSLLYYYLTALLCSGDFTLVFYQMGELEYISFNCVLFLDCCVNFQELVKNFHLVLYARGGHSDIDVHMPEQQQKICEKVSFLRQNT